MISARLLTYISLHDINVMVSTPSYDISDMAIGVAGTAPCSHTLPRKINWLGLAPHVHYSQSQTDEHRR